MPTSLATLRPLHRLRCCDFPGTALLLTAAVALTGCAGFSTVAPTTVSTAATHVMTGSVHGGQQPVVGAHVHLYEVGAAGYGSASTNIITTADGSDADGNYVLTDASGNFSLPVTPATSSYTCTNANNQTYLLATGGNPGFADPATNNTAITLMAVLGTCGNIVNLPNAVINEISTVAAVTALQQFIVDPIHIGTSAGNQPGLVAGTGLALDLVPIATGVASTVNGAGTGVTPQAKVNTLGNILAPCINSTGPGSSDCTKLFTAVTPSGGTQPTDVASAMLLLAENPGLNIAALYGLPNAAAPFQPTLSAAPNDFALSVTYTGGGLTAPINVVIDASGNAWMADCPSCNKLAGTDKIVGISPAGIFQSGAGGYTAGIHKPEGLAFDGAGNLWSTDDRSGATPDQVVKMTGGTVDFAFNDSNISTPIGVAIDANNNAWVANQTFSGLAVKISPSGSDIATASDPGNTYFPTGIGIDGTGAIYMAGTGSGTVLKFTSAGTVTYDSSNGVSPADRHLDRCFRGRPHHQQRLQPVDQALRHLRRPRLLER